MASRQIIETRHDVVMADGTAWQPGEMGADRPAYVALADAIAHDLARGLLAPGDRLPTHRALAATLGVTVRTVARGYAEAERRGLVGGEVGRGTYVRTAFGLAPARSTTVDLSALHPPIAAGPAPAELLAGTLRSLAGDPVALQMVADTESSADDPSHRAAAAAWVAHGDFAPRADDMLLTAGAQHALALCLLALVPAGSKVATTALTNPGLIAAARALSAPLVVVESDEDGMLPGALDDACSREAIGAVHVQPTFDNPRGHTMPRGRREQLADVAGRRDLWLIEDDPLGPLAPDRPDPVAALAPTRTCYIASAAKAFALGLRVGMLSAPEQAYPRLAAALRASTWLLPPLLGEVVARWVRDGTAQQIVDRRIAACRERGAVARGILADLAVHGDPGSPHLWVDLPAPWSAGSLVAALRDEEVLVAPGDDYAADRTVPAHGIRIGLNAEVSDDALGRGLEAVARVMSGGPTAS
jgi:DNA-binding transcriptional MocR family regulator